MRKSIVGFIALGVSIALVAPAAAYKTSKNFSGGAIEGVVKFDGTPPAAKTLEVNKNTDVCGKKPVPDESLVVGKGGGVQWAVVRLIDVQEGKGWSSKEWGSKTNVIDQNGCFFHPHVLAVKAKRSVTILNNDGILHNFHTFPKKNKSANRAQPKFLKKMTLKSEFFENPEVMNVKCDVHGWMSGYIVVAENPYTVVTDANGAFKLTNVPPGKYKLEVWQETLGTSVQTVEVKAKETAKVNVSLKK